MVFSCSRNGTAGPFRLVALVGILAAALPLPCTGAVLSFDRTDWTGVGGGVGSVQAGDMDGDGDLDIVGVGGNNIFIFANDGGSGWTRYGDLDSTGQSGLNGSELFDSDGDGDLDIIGARYYSDLGWWENPGGALSDTPWSFHSFDGTVDGWYLHDMIRADLDGDGTAGEFVCVLQQGYWNAPFHIYWYRPGGDPRGPWLRGVIAQNRQGPSNNHAGVDVADIDGDGDADLAFSNGWFESPGNPSGSWSWHKITDVYGVSNSLARDMDGDGVPDLVLAAGHHGQGLYWFGHGGDPRLGPWVRHNISAVLGDIMSRHYYGGAEDGSDHLHHPEGLQAADLDGDGDLDLLVSELFFGEDPGEPGWDEQVHNLYVFENMGGSPPRWRKQNVSPLSWPGHLPSLVDIDGDGRLDIITEGPRINNISYLRNVTVFPQAEIRANGLDGPLVVTAGDPLAVKVRFLGGSLKGFPVDWWVVVRTPLPGDLRWYRFVPEKRAWVPGLAASRTGPCTDIGPGVILQGSDLPPGDYTFSFGADTVADGAPTMREMVYDKVKVTITAP